MGAAIEKAGSAHVCFLLRCMRQNELLVASHRTGRTCCTYYFTAVALLAYLVPLQAARAAWTSC
jgi:hypothetical protein